LNSRLTAFLILTLLGLIVFGRSVFFDLLLFDDDHHLIKNSIYSMPGFSGLFEAWRGPVQHLYIPVVYTVWFFLGKLAGLFVETSSGFYPAPALFHGFNLLIHLFNTFWVWIILRLILRICFRRIRSWRICFRRTHLQAAPWVGALFFLFHPLQNETVVWISGLRDLLATFLGLQPSI
jgi:hypothetical protein